ncbi:hypothetical protein [Acinetobacter sp. SA01]|uniref:hypothetical protein n=1 Tax=Acinetobacter sp. SA01 TaxID=1862567 RepID=UPI00140D4E79|nr:hypothetical protein [Acinetobacter sp. SA01]
MSELRQNFEKSFPIPAHWIEWSESKNRYDCHVGLADSKCAEYNKMFNVWCVQQAKVDEIEHQKSLQELAINQISQANQEWQRINAELQKRVDNCAALAKEWRTLAREMCPLDDKYVIGARLGCAQDIEEVLRGKHE